MTKAQEVYEKVEALVAASGMKKADAFRQVADELGMPFNSARGAFYSHTRTLGGTPGAKPKRTTPTDPIEQATSVLTRALEVIDENVEAAKTRAEEAAAEYKELRDSAATRKAAIKTKIEALNA